MPKLIWSCADCGTVLPLWQVKCFNCRRLALSWLHLGVAVVIGLVAVVVVMKVV